MKLKFLLIFLVFSCNFYAQTKDKKYAVRQVTSSDGFFISGLECFHKPIEFNVEEQKYKSNTQEIILEVQDSLIKKFRVKSVIVKNYNKKIAKFYEKLNKKNNIIYQSYSEYNNKGSLTKKYEESIFSSSFLKEISYQYNLKDVLEGKEIKETNFCFRNRKNVFYKNFEKDRRICRVSKKKKHFEYDSLMRIKRIKIIEDEKELIKKYFYGFDTLTIVKEDFKEEVLEKVEEFFINDTVKTIHRFSFNKRPDIYSEIESKSIQGLFFNTEKRLIKKNSLMNIKRLDLYHDREYVFKSRRVSFYNYNNDVLQEKREAFSSNTTENNCNCIVKYNYNKKGLIDKIVNEVSTPKSEDIYTATTTFEYQFYKN